MFRLQFLGGVTKPSEHMNEKFLLFFLIGEQEISLYQMLKDGQAERSDEKEDEYKTNHQICKLFISRQGFGIARQFHSFYLKLEEDFPTLKILPFSEESTGFYFKAKAKMLEKREVLMILPKRSESRIFITRQGVLPTDLQKRMVRIDRSDLREGIRYVKIGKRKGG